MVAISGAKLGTDIHGHRNFEQGTGSIAPAS